MVNKKTTRIEITRQSGEIERHGDIEGVLIPRSVLAPAANGYSSVQHAPNIRELRKLTYYVMFEHSLDDEPTQPWERRGQKEQ